MKIIKIYSGIQTLDQEIREAITAKKLTWNKLNKVLMRPYEILSKEELGTLANIPAPL